MSKNENLQNLETSVNLIKQGRIDEALPKLKNLYDSEYQKETLSYLYCYALSESSNFRAAEQIYPDVIKSRNENGDFFRALIAKNLNYDEDFLLFAHKSRSPQMVYEALLLNEKFEEAAEISDRLKKSGEICKFFALTCKYIFSNHESTNKHSQNIVGSFSKNKVEKSVVSQLNEYKSDLSPFKSGEKAATHRKDDISANANRPIFPSSKIVSGFLDQKTFNCFCDDKTALNPTFIYFCTKNAILIPRLIDKYVIDGLKFDKTIDFLIYRDLFLSGLKYQNILTKSPKINIKNMHAISEKEILDSILHQCDDWRLYQYALENNIILEPKKTLNHQYFDICLNPNHDRVLKFIEKQESFIEIERCLEKVVDINRLIENCKKQSFEYYYVKFYTKTSIDTNFIKEICALFFSNPSVRLFKLLCAALISSKKHSNLLFCYYLVKKHRFPETYEISIIETFLAKYFLDIDDLIRLVRKLDIKNTILPKMSYLWHDLVCISKKIAPIIETHFNGLILELYSVIKENLYFINKNLTSVIKQANLDFAYDALRTRKDLKEVMECIFQKIRTKRYIEFCSQPNLVNFLGRKSTWLFAPHKYQENQDLEFFDPHKYQQNSDVELFAYTIDNIDNVGVLDEYENIVLFFEREKDDFIEFLKDLRDRQTHYFSQIY